MIQKINWNQKEHGCKLYAVMGKCVETIVGKQAWAGLGWIQNEKNFSDKNSYAFPTSTQQSCGVLNSVGNKDKTGKGLFVEHSGFSQEDVKKLIKTSLNNMKQYRQEKYGEINLKTIGIKCSGKPVCAVVVAIFKIEDWNDLKVLKS